VATRKVWMEDEARVSEGGGGTAEGPPEDPAFAESTFSKEDSKGQVVNFQILNLGRQLYVWASTSSSMNNLALAMPVTSQSSPAMTHLVAGAGAETAERVSKRLAQKVGLPVAVSWSVEGDDLLQLWAEKVLIVEMMDLQEKLGLPAKLGNLAV